MLWTYQCLRYFRDLFMKDNPGFEFRRDEGGHWLKRLRGPCGPLLGNSPSSAQQTYRPRKEWPHLQISYLICRSDHRPLQKHSPSQAAGAAKKWVAFRRFKSWAASLFPSYNFWSSIIFIFYLDGPFTESGLIPCSWSRGLTLSPDTKQDLEATWTIEGG